MRNPRDFIVSPNLSIKVLIGLSSKDICEEAVTCGCCGLSIHKDEMFSIHPVTKKPWHIKCLTAQSDR